MQQKKYIQYFSRLSVNDHYKHVKSQSADASGINK